MSTYCFNHLKVNDKFLHQIKVIQTYQQNTLAPFSSWKINIWLILLSDCLLSGNSRLVNAHHWSSVLWLCRSKRHRLLMNCASFNNCFEFSDFIVIINSYLNNSRGKKKLFFLRLCAQCPSTKCISTQRRSISTVQIQYLTPQYTFAKLMYSLP